MKSPIIPFYFLIAFYVGMFIVYVSYTIPDIMVQYPTLENAGKIIYQSDNDSCYKYKKVNTACNNSKKIVQYD